MSSALVKAAPLKPDIRLAQAISEFEAKLSTEQKSILQTYRAHSVRTPPDVGDVRRLTAEIDKRRASLLTGRRCLGPRFTSLLQTIQQFAAIGDVLVGGSQHLLACGVWSAARMTLLSFVNFHQLFEKVSELFMLAGRCTLRYETLAICYTKSKNLQRYICEYQIQVVKLCATIFDLTKKSTFGLFTSTFSDTAFSSFRSDFDKWSSAIKDELDMLVAVEIRSERSDISYIKNILSQASDSRASHRRMKLRKLVLDACSTFHYDSAWKQLRKMGNATTIASSSEFAQWRDATGSSALLVAGRLGAGKSVAMANMVDDLYSCNLDPRPTVAYFFCRYDKPESLLARTILGSICQQLLGTFQDLGQFAEILNKETSNGFFEKVLDALPRSFPSNNKTYILLDGLNECPIDQMDEVLNCMRLWQSVTNVHLCVSYQLGPQNDLNNDFTNYNTMQTLTVRIPQSNPDIVAYIDAELEACIATEKLVLEDPTLIVDIRDALVSRSSGMFLWVTLQVQALCDLEGDDVIQEALNDLPQDLSETFCRILRKAQNKGKQYQRKLLEILVAAQEPLTREQIFEALCVVPGDYKQGLPRVRQNERSILLCCGNLLFTDEEERTIHFVHSSVRQYLLKGAAELFDPDFSSVRSRRYMATLVLTYLNYDIADSSVSAKTPKTAICSPGSTIINSAIGRPAVKELAIRFLRTKKTKVDLDLNRVLIEATHQSSLSAGRHSLLSYAKKHWTCHTLDADLDANENDALIRNVLLTGRVELDVLEDKGCTFLRSAAADGHVDLLALLLETGKFNPSQDFLQGCETWLPAALRAENVRAASLLVKYGAPLKVSKDDNQGVLRAAVGIFSDQILRQILEISSGSVFSILDLEEALQYASNFRLFSIIGLLCDLPQIFDIRVHFVKQLLRNAMVVKDRDIHERLISVLRQNHSADCMTFDFASLVTIGEHRRAYQLLKPINRRTAGLWTFPTLMVELVQEDDFDDDLVLSLAELPSPEYRVSDMLLNAAIRAMQLRKPALAGTLLDNIVTSATEPDGLVPLPLGKGKKEESGAHFVTSTGKKAATMREVVRLYGHDYVLGTDVFFDTFERMHLDAFYTWYFCDALDIIRKLGPTCDLLNPESVHLRIGRERLRSRRSEIPGRKKVLQWISVAYDIDVQLQHGLTTTTDCVEYALTMERGEYITHVWYKMVDGFAFAAKTSLSRRFSCGERADDPSLAYKTGGDATPCFKGFHGRVGFDQILEIDAIWGPMADQSPQEIGE